MTEPVNFFDMLAEAQTPAPVKRKLDRATLAAMKKRDLEKEMAAEEGLVRAFARHRKAERDALVAGPHGKDVRGLVAFMKTMTLSSAPALIEMVRRAAWTQELSRSERSVLLGMVSAGIERVRAKADLPPYEDELPWDPPKAFTQIKALLGAW